MHYIYIIQSQKDKSTYIGLTANLKARLQEHNRGNVTYTRSSLPYKVIWYCAFSKKSVAVKFEKYLKQGSGFAFAKKHLLP